MKRILILDRFYFPDDQATAVYLTELTTALKDQFCFEILCGPPLILTENKAPETPASRVYLVPTLRLSKQILLARLLNDLSFLIAALIRGLFITRPDLVVSQTSPPAVWWIGFLLSRWHRTPWIHVCQDLFPFFSWLERVNDFFLKRADRLIVIGEDMREKLLKKGFPASRVIWISNWVDPEFIQPLPKRNSFSEKEGLADKFVILYAGNFSRIHNFEDLLDAAEGLRDHPEIVFLFVGDGALKDKLIRARRSRGLRNVLILPFQPRSKVPEVLATADVGIVLLKKGKAGFSVPSKIYSLLASARPIIAGLEETSEVARMIRESNSGFVVPPGDPKCFSKTIEKLFQDPALRQELGRNARRFVEEKNFRLRAFRDYGRIFRETLEASRGGPRSRPIQT